MRFFAVSAALCLLILTNPAVAGGSLVGSEWRPVEIGPMEIPAESDMFVRFADAGRLEGHGGCNGFFGSYEMTGNAIEIGPLGSTQMACEPPVLEREMALFAALGSVAMIARDRADLTLSDGDGNLIMRLVQNDWD